MRTEASTWRQVTNCYTGGVVRAYHRSPMRLLVLILALVVSAESALAQRDGRRQDQRPQRQMRDDERQRMRDDMRDAYRERQGRPERPRQMSPEDRDKLRSDLEEANRQLRRKK